MDSASPLPCISMVLCHEMWTREMWSYVQLSSWRFPFPLYVNNFPCLNSPIASSGLLKCEIAHVSKCLWEKGWLKRSWTRAERQGQGETSKDTWTSICSVFITAPPHYSAFTDLHSYKMQIIFQCLLPWVSRPGKNINLDLSHILCILRYD